MDLIELVFAVIVAGIVIWCVVTFIASAINSRADRKEEEEEMRRQNASRRR
jgi:type II secretory pathway pseudopilin PulG